MFSEYCSKVSVASHYPALTSESQSLHVEVLDIPSHRWEVTFHSVNMLDSDLDDFWPLVEKLKAHTPFQWKLPKVSDIRGEGGLARVQQTNSGMEQVNVYNAPPNTIWLKRNDMITFANHTKVYRVLEDVTTDNAGVGLVLLNCPLKQTLPENTVVDGTGAVFTLIKRPGFKPLSYERAAGTRIFKSIQIEFIELL